MVRLNYHFDLYNHNDGIPIMRNSNALRLFGLFVGLTLSCVTLPALAASFDKALTLMQHGLLVDAKRELIDVVYSDSVAPIDRAGAYYTLGKLAYDENREELALDSWGQVVERFPDTTYAMLAEDSINQIIKRRARAIKQQEITLDPPFNVSFGNSGATYWAKIGVVLKPYQPQLAQAVEHHSKEIRDQLKEHFGDQRYEDYMSRDGKEQIRRESLQIVQEILGNGDIPPVQDLVITELFIRKQ